MLLAQEFVFNPQNDTFGYTSRSFTFGGEEKILISGEMQYYRIDPTEWDDRIKKMKGALVSAASTYIPWGLHEPEKGVFNYDGSRDVFSFNSTLEKYNMHSILKPSGYVCNEFNGGGFPAWIWAEDCWPRTSDPKFYTFLDGWLENIIPQLNKLEIGKGGNMIACQLENEYGKGNYPYLVYYRDKARSLGLQVPLLNNGGGDLGYPGTISTYDMYLKPVTESLTKRNWTRPGNLLTRSKPRFSSEYESGWLNAEYSTMETQMGGLPGDWLKAIAALAYFKGDAGLNYYMFCGGTDIGMNASKKFPNSYFNVAPIGEYGQLNPSYYRYKELHGFVKSFESTFLYGEEKQPDAEDIPKHMMYKKLQHKDEVIFMIVNTSKEEHSFLFDPNQQDYKPHRVTIKPLGSKLLPSNFSLGGALHVLNTSSDVLFKKNGVMLLFDAVLNEGFIRLKGDVSDQIKQLPATASVVANSKSTEIRYMHTTEDQCVRVGDAMIWILSRERAQNTFYCQNEGEVSGALVSGMYFAHVESTGQGKQVGFLANPGQVSQQTFIDFDTQKISEFSYTAPNTGRIIRQPVTGLTIEGLSLTGLERAPTTNIDWGTAYEEAGLYDNGYALYTGTFKSSAERMTILIPEINDYFSVYLNGALVYKGERTATLNLDDLKKGKNKLSIFTLSGGLDKNGPGATMSLSGMNMPIYVNPVGEIKINRWERRTLFEDSRAKHEFYKDKDVLLAYRDPVYSSKIGMDIVALSKTRDEWVSVDFSRKEFLQKFDGNVDWSKMSEMIDKATLPVGVEYKGKKALLKINDADVWYSVYVNGQHFQGGWQGWDRWGFEDRPRYIDVTSALKYGEDNNFIIRCWQGPKGGGLQDAVDLIFFEEVMDGTAQLHDINAYLNKRLKTPPSSNKPEKSVLLDNNPNILSGVFQYETRKDIQAPLYLEMSGFTDVSCVYINGRLMAKYYPYGYSDKLRLLPSFLKEGENKIAVVGAFKQDDLPAITIKSYFVKAVGKYKIEN